MAKAVFQRNQKVWVESVGAWSTVEKIVPIWARGFDEPVRVTYDVGMGREFHAHELRAEDAVGDTDSRGESWRMLRARNKWQTPEDTAHHPYPGTFPIIVTDPNDWGGWRVPGAEYDRDPTRIEHQARAIASCPALQSLAQELIQMVEESPQEVPPFLQVLARKAAGIVHYIQEVPAAGTPIESPELPAQAAE
jgi:hypothetical protein